MKRSFFPSFLGLLSTVLVATLATGCAGNTDGEEHAGDGEDDVAAAGQTEDALIMPGLGSTHWVPVPPPEKRDGRYKKDDAFHAHCDKGKGTVHIYIPGAFSDKGYGLEDVHVHYDSVAGPKVKKIRSTSLNTRQMIDTGSMHTHYWISYRVSKLDEIGKDRAQKLHEHLRKLIIENAAKGDGYCSF